jgi:hypothetical protein
MRGWMHVIPRHGGGKAAWARLHRDQDLRSINESPEAAELDKELLDL